MAASRRRVSYTDLDDGAHSVEVEAKSLYEAVALAVAEFRDDKIVTEGPGPMTEFCITLKRRPIEH